MTTEEFIDKSAILHGNKYDYSDTCYIKVSEKIIINCYKHGPFRQLPYSHLRGVGCSKCGFADRLHKRLTSSVFFDRCSQKHKNKYDYSRSSFKTISENIDIICPNHGLFTIIAKKHLKGVECPTCKCDEKNNQFDDFVLKANIFHNGKYNYSSSLFKNKYTDIDIICPVHGNFRQPPFRHLKSGCKLCGDALRISKNTISVDEFIRRARGIHGSDYIYDNTNYINSSVKIYIRCSKCNSTFPQTPTSHLRGRGCPICKLSHGERKINNVLLAKDIKFNRQKTFNDLLGIGGKHLKFDFFVPDYNICIEYDGEQHFNTESRYWSNYVMEHDNIKNLYCANNKIRLLRISYLDKDRIEEILLSNLGIGSKS